MSWETQAWAGKQRPDHPSSKLILIGLAQCADANHCAWPSVKWLCDFSGYDRKTVLAALKRLAEGMFPLICDTGERKGRTKQVKVYQLASAEAENATSDQPAETVPKAEQYRKRNSTAFSDKGSQKWDTEPFREPIPPSSPNGEETPTPKIRKGRKAKGTQLADDWQAPPIDDLSASAIKLARQWPAGAYEAVCETFRLHYQTTDGPAGIRANWNAVLSKWVVKDHAKIMRDAKAGVSFASLAPVPKPSTDRAAEAAPVKAKTSEDETSHRMHELLRRRIGPQLYDQWFSGSALIHDKPGVKMIVASEFRRSWIEERWKDLIGGAAREATATAIKWVRIEVERE